MIKYIFLFCAIGMFCSCEKILFEDDQSTKDAIENFDYLWSEIDKKYSYFRLKNINWDSLKNIYRPMLHSGSDEQTLFDVLAMMMDDLRDDHTNLVSPFNISSYGVAMQSPTNYNARTISEYYLPDAWRTATFEHGFLDNQEIGYIRYESFSGYFTDDHLDFVLRRYQATKGLILDLRDNGGGSLGNVVSILSRFADSKTLVGYSITRNGPDHNDFGPREPFYITPDNKSNYLKPIIVLIDRGSYSATTFFSLATLALPNITLMGDTTGGGGGLPNGGQLPNGWTYRFSISQLLDTDGRNFAESGVPPEIQVNFDWTDLSKDEILDRAIAELQ